MLTNTLNFLRNKKTVALLLLAIFCSFWANAQTIPLSLMARDSRSGMQLSPKFTVKSLKTEFDLPVITKSNDILVKVVKGDKIQIMANQEGYYPDEKIYEIDDSFSDEGRNIVFELDPRPALNFSFTIMDAINGKPLPASFKLSFGNKIVLKNENTEGDAQARTILTEQGKYTLEIAKDGYSKINEEIDIEIADPPKSFKKEYKLSKQDNSLLISVVQGATNEPVMAGEVRIVDNKNKVLKSGRFENGLIAVNYGEAKEVKLTIEAEGFVPLNEKWSTDKDKFIVKLKKKSVIPISVYDAFTGKRMVADVIITEKSGKKSTIQSNSQQDVVYYPQSEGTISFSVVVAGFQSKDATVDVSSLEGLSRPVTLNMLNLLEEYLILVVDQDKIVVPNNDVRVIDEIGNEMPVSLNSVTGEWRVKLQRDRNFTLKITAPSFESYTQPLDLFKGKLIGITLQKLKNKITLTAIDKYTKEEIEGSVKIVNQRGLSTTDKINKGEGYVLEMLPKTEMVVTVSATGYTSVSHTFNYMNIENKTLEMVKTKYPITFQIYDIETNNAIQPDYFSLLDSDKSKPIKIDSGSGFTVDLETEATYYIDTRRDDYKPHLSPFKPISVLETGSLVKKVFLSKNDILVQQFSIIDKATKGKVGNAVVKAYDETDKEIQVKQTEEGYGIQVGIKKPFRIYVNVEGYQIHDMSFDEPKKEPIVVEVDKLKSDEIIVSSYDSFLEKAVSGKFTVLENGKSVETPPLENGTKTKITKTEGKGYSVIFSALGYGESTQSLDKLSSVGTEKIINVSKNTYPYVLRLYGEGKNRLSVSPVVQLQVESKETKAPIYNFEKGEFLFEILPASDYKYEIIADGYENYVGAINKELVAKDGLRLDILLQPKAKEVVVTVTKEEPKKEEVVIEKAKPEEVKKLTIFDENALNLANLPAQTQEIKKAFLSTDATTKKYTLTNVFFDQSSPKMQDVSNIQLKQLIEVLAENKQISVELIGHTDDQGDKRQNQYLSEFRAKVVGNYLFNNGIENSRIKTRGSGPSFPIAPNDSEENRAKNRRVEIRVIQN